MLFIASGQVLPAAPVPSAYNVVSDVSEISPHPGVSPTPGECHYGPGRLDDRPKTCAS